jgi:predicted nucleotidyltransferase
MMPPQIFEFLRKAVSKFETLSQVILFGSFVRGEVDRRSDVDVLLIFNERNPERKHLRKVVKLGNEVIDELSSKGEKTWNFQFVIARDIGDLDLAMQQAIIQSGIIIYGKPSPKKFRRKILFSYTLAGKTRSEMVRFNRALRLAGVLGKKSKNTILVDEIEGRKVNEILNTFGIQYSQRLVFESA